jgi:hypothetical protein
MKLTFRAALALAFALFGFVAQAKVVRLEITSKQPYGSFRSGEYVRWDGRIIGELAPLPDAIPDLEKASRNAKGMVEYAARIILFMPADPTVGNGGLLVDVPNRGKAYAHALYNSPRQFPYQSGNLDAGTGFLEDNGFSTAELYWARPGRGPSVVRRHRRQEAICRGRRFCHRARCGGLSGT